jgi:hypothetical protein
MTAHVLKHLELNAIIQKRKSILLFVNIFFINIVIERIEIKLQRSFSYYIRQVVVFDFKILNYSSSLSVAYANHLNNSVNYFSIQTSCHCSRPFLTVKNKRFDYIFTPCSKPIIRNRFHSKLLDRFMLR